MKLENTIRLQYGSWDAEIVKMRVEGGSQTTFNYRDVTYPLHILFSPCPLGKMATAYGADVCRN